MREEKRAPDGRCRRKYIEHSVLKLLFDCTDGRVKLWVYAVTAVGFIFILFIIALSFLVWYVLY